MEIPSACPDGQHQPGVGKAECIENIVRCNAGKYVANGMCKDCPSGHYCVGGMLEPLPCKKGTYQPVEGQEECVDCPDGRTCTTTGSSSAILCPFRKECWNGKPHILKGITEAFRVLEKNCFRKKRFTNFFLNRSHLLLNLTLFWM